MKLKDNQADLAGALQQSKPTSSPPPAGNDGTIVTLPSGQRIELGQNGH